MIADDLLSWYETNLPARERKLRGHFSTPPRLVEQILDACGYTGAHNLADLRVLDPACGSGNFLVGVTRRLIDFGRQARLPPAELARLIQNNIWGLDPDPIACFLAEMQLHTLFAGEIQSQSAPNNYNVQAPLLETPSEALAQPGLHIHQADGLVMPWEQCNNVDLFLANPPYLASKNTDLSGYRSAQRRGQSDSYLLFIDIALQVVRPGGWIALVLPDPVLARANAAKERQQLLAETTLHHIWHLANVFTAYVGAVVLIAQKCPPAKEHQIAWKREHWPHSSYKKRTPSSAKPNKRPGIELAQVPTQIIAQRLLSIQPDAELRYLLSHTQGTLIGRLHEHLTREQTDKVASSRLIPLSSYVLIRRGEELAKDSSLLVENPCETDKKWYPVLRGGADIAPYRQPQAQRWIEQTCIAKRIERYLAPKLLIVKSAGYLQTALDLKGHVVLQTLYLLQIQTSSPLQKQTAERDREQQNEDELYFLLALLNSQVLRNYVYILHTAYKWVQPQIEQRVLAQLPIPIICDICQKEQIVKRARLMMQTAYESGPATKINIQDQEMYREQERAIRNLYETALDEPVLQI